MVTLVTETVYVPDPMSALGEVREVLLGLLTEQAVTDVLAWSARMYTLAAQVADANRDETKAHLTEAYRGLKGILATTPLGAPGQWPEDFWTTKLGRLIYYCFDYVYGDALLSQTQAARILGVKTTRLGALQRELKLDYLVNPDASHPSRNRRRISPEMLDDFQRHRCDPDGDEEED